MSSSPFSTFEEFSSAAGPIYTFANSPAIIVILLILSLLISVYFIYASFFMTQDDIHKAIDTKAVGLLIVAGFASVMGSIFSLHPQRSTDAIAPRQGQTTQADRPGWQPLALLGLTGVGGAVTGRRAKPNRPRKYRLTRRSR